VFKGSRWFLAGLVALTTALGTAVAAQHLIGSGEATLRLTTVPMEQAGPGGSLADPAPAPSNAPALSGPAAERPATGRPARTAAAKPKAPRTTRAKAHRPGAKATVRAAAGPRSGTTSRAAAGGGAGTGRIRFGVRYSGVATFYGATGAGNCSFEASDDLMVAAMNQADYENSQACGAFLAVTGPGGSKVTVKVVDRCPECPPGALDLSRQAFTRLAPASAGKIAISWTLLSPSSLGPIAYKYKDGSSRYWCGIQVRGNRNPVRSLEVRAGGSWKALTRQNYNFFLSENGTGCGGDLRVTDIYGNRLTDRGISLSPGTVQRGAGQFGPPA
jgi:expansin